MAKHLSSGCTAHELHLETPVEAAETPEAHRSEDMGGGNDRSVSNSVTSSM